MLGLLASSLAGCATHPANCDPSNIDAGTLTKAHCLLSGEYERRTEEKKANLQDELRINALFQEAYLAIQAEQEKVRFETSDSSIALEKISNTVNSLLESLTDKSQQDRQLNDRVVQLRQDVVELQNQPGESPLQKRQQLSELMVKVADLQKALELR